MRHTISTKTNRRSKLLKNVQICFRNSLPAHNNNDGPSYFLHGETLHVLCYNSVTDVSRWNRVGSCMRKRISLFNVYPKFVRHRSRAAHVYNTSTACAHQLQGILKTTAPISHYYHTQNSNLS